jgi:alpha-beta hydrolase superfamily lysophospholipase
MAVLHIHGFTGNFYQEKFVDHIADQLTAAGFSFLTGNTRGHDYLAYVPKKNTAGLTCLLVGGAFEALENASQDIAAWVNFLADHDHTHVVLEGESLGTVKIVLYQHHTHDQRVQGLVLMSPLDHIGLQKSALKDRYDAAILAAKQLVATGNGEALMPTVYCPLWRNPISAQTYVSAFTPKTNTGVFNVHDPHASFTELGSITCPILALYGTVQEAVVDNRVEEALQTIQKAARSSQRCDTALVQGAPHNYLGHEVEVATLIRR